MPNEQCWILNDECSHSHTLTLSHSHTLTVSIVDSFTNVEWGRMNAEWSMLDAEYLLLLSHSHTHTHTPSHTQIKIMLKRSQSEQGALHCYVEKDKIHTPPFTIPTANTVLLSRKRQDCLLPYPNRGLCFVISKKRRLNRSRSQQRTQHDC